MGGTGAKGDKMLSEYARKYLIYHLRMAGRFKEIEELKKSPFYHHLLEPDFIKPDGPKEEYQYLPCKLVGDDH